MVATLAPTAFDVAGAGFQPDRLPWMGAALFVLSLLGLFLLTRPARRLFARFTPIDPAHPVHAIALSLSAVVLINLAFTVAVGLDNLADMLQSSTQGQPVQSPAPALVGPEHPVRFDGPDRRRLAFPAQLRRCRCSASASWSPRGARRSLGLGVGLVMVPIVIAAEALASRLGLGAGEGVERLTEQLIGPLTMSIPGILTLGLAAALGEETVFRGALQPRFGLLLTAVLFALLHSQYGISFSTLAVFLVGLVLGVLRIRANTTTAMITHAVYNMSLGLIAFLGLMQNF